MLTVSQLSKMINKSEHIIRYWINHDERFKECYWTKQEVEVGNISGKYKTPAWVCDEGNLVRITEYLSSKKTNNTQPKKHWTDITIHCYERKMRCNGCTFFRYCGQYERPPIKQKVLEFVRLYGEPTNE